MTDQLIPPDVLARADRILFVAHLALGDFTYMESCFKVFHSSYPHIKIDIWVDELRRTYDFRQWQGLRKYSLFDWLEVSPYFDTIYKKTYSPFTFRSSVREARAKNYPIVISFGLSRRTFYAGLVHKLAPKAFTAAIVKRYKSYDFMKRRVFGRLNATLVDYPEGSTHVSDIYAAWFHSLFGLNISREDRYPQLSIPAAWRTDACKRLSHWGLDDKVQRKNRLVFVNAFSKQNERSWTVEKALELIAAMKSLDGWRGSDFVINTVPEKWSETKQTLERLNVKSNVFLFSAGDNFFQLPAILEQCDLIISVETAVMHLANAVNVPVIALMRQLTPEWMPINKEGSRVVMTQGRDDWVQEIALESVINALPDVKTMQWRAV